MSSSKDCLSPLLMRGTLTASASFIPSPFACLGLASFSECIDVKLGDGVLLSLDLDGSMYQTEVDIIYQLAHACGFQGDSTKVNSFVQTASSVTKDSDVQRITKTFDELDGHLTYRTFLVGHDITSADWTVWGSVKGNLKAIGLLKSGKWLHLARWFKYFDSLDSTQHVLSLLSAARSDKIKANKAAAGFAMELQNARNGEVVTRFPPEPSGYLHIGHAKAVILNQHFAEMYQGRMLVRFDDTNPSKETAEFEETILADLRLFGVAGNEVSRTSDYFEDLHTLAIRLIDAGKAYADDTNATVLIDSTCDCPPKAHGRLARMAYERFHGIPSARRNSLVEENKVAFAEMGKGSSEGSRWCLRAKISVDDPNKAMRDPVIYRCNSATHHKTGDKWKIYPTYDFACPVVDSLEGVTHALRTNEYRDRNAQYAWMIRALGLRPVDIWDFSRLNFVYTVLSKRNLQQFVDKGLVSGWDDPRFPTVRGIRRRGLTVEALKQFMLQQGPSQAVLSLEWDSLWTLNKKIIDAFAPRYWAILEAQAVRVTLVGGPATAEWRFVPKHKKNDAIGQKCVVYSSTILIDYADAISFEDQEEITLMEWGNAIVEKPADKDVSQGLNMVLHVDGDFRKTKKKVHWLAQPTSLPDENAHKLVDITLIDYDYLITKRKLEDGDNWQDFVTPVTEFREEAVADPNVRQLEKADRDSDDRIIQFERKGYYRYDGRGGDGRLEFIKIPDGRAVNLASKAASS